MIGWAPMALNVVAAMLNVATPVVALRVAVPNEAAADERSRSVIVPLGKAQPVAGVIVIVNVTVPLTVELVSVGTSVPLATVTAASMALLAVL